MALVSFAVGLQKCRSLPQGSHPLKGSHPSRVNRMIILRPQNLQRRGYCMWGSWFRLSMVAIVPVILPAHNP